MSNEHDFIKYLDKDEKQLYQTAVKSREEAKNMRNCKIKVFENLKRKRCPETDN